jgi:hypothetical protein
MSILKKNFPVQQLQVHIKEPSIFSNEILEVNIGLYCNLNIKSYKFQISNIMHERIYDLLCSSKKFVHRNLSLFYGIKIESLKNSKEFNLYLIFEDPVLEYPDSLIPKKNLFDILCQITEFFIFFNTLSIEIIIFPDDLLITKNYEIRFNNLYLNYFIKELYGIDKLYSLKKPIYSKREIKDSQYYIDTIISLIDKQEYIEIDEIKHILSMLKDKSDLKEILFQVNNYLKEINNLYM